MPTRSEWEREDFVSCLDPDNQCGWRMETYMDRSKSTSYGWRDDPTVLRAVDSSTNSLTTFPKIHNMQRLMQLQAKYNRTLVQSVQYTEQPSIAYCWYWGCHAVCQPLRWAANRWWLFSSMLLFALQTSNMAIVIALLTKPKEKSGLPVTAPAPPSFVMNAPLFGRRTRQLGANPSVLHF